ncbi:hypothetical protein BGX34_006646 [Mortierella sp. NVP85]|nr:hypothetical protein BGX34_006646 [Mortierella sp. NVP85]
MPSLFARILKLDRFEPDRIVTSNIVHPRTLVFIRAFEFFYVLAATISVWATTDSAVDYFKYFTHLSYFGLMAYLFASVIWGILYLRQPESERAHWIKNGSSWWGYLHWLLYSTVVTYSAFVPIVFWVFLARDIGSWTPLDFYQNISEHAMDGVFGTIVELVFNRHYLEPMHSLVVAIVMTFYMLLTFVIYAIYGDW